MIQWGLANAQQQNNETGGPQSIATNTTNVNMALVHGTSVDGRSPPEPTKWRSISLFCAADEAEIHPIPRFVSVHIWTKIIITLLTPHANDPRYISGYDKNPSQA